MGGQLDLVLCFTTPGFLYDHLLLSALLPIVPLFDSEPPRFILPFRGPVFPVSAPYQVDSRQDDNQNRNQDHGSIGVVGYHAMMDFLQEDSPTDDCQECSGKNDREVNPCPQPQQKTDDAADQRTSHPKGKPDKEQKARYAES